MDPGIERYRGNFEEARRAGRTRSCLIDPGGTGIGEAGNLIRCAARPAHADLGCSQEPTMTRTPGNGSRRTDTEIFSQVRKALDERLSVPATVRVHIDDGTAWLTGTVRLSSERMEAEDVVRQVPGVQRIMNEITVTQTASAEGFEPPDTPA
jgi:hypothetical protein